MANCEHCGCCASRDIRYRRLTGRVTMLFRNNKMINIERVFGYT